MFDVFEACRFAVSCVFPVFGFGFGVWCVYRCGSQVIAKIDGVCSSIEPVSFEDRQALGLEIEKLEAEWVDVKAATQRVLGKKAKLA